MKNVNRNFRDDRLALKNLSPFLEITEADTVNFNKDNRIRYTYPRHVCFNGIDTDRSLVLDPITSNAQKDSDLQVDMREKLYLVSDEIIKTIHLENLRQNLEKRLQVAKIKGDDRLINLLEKEFRQLNEC
jgi:hypothetical protein